MSPLPFILGCCMMLLAPHLVEAKAPETSMVRVMLPRSYEGIKPTKRSISTDAKKRTAKIATSRKSFHRHLHKRTLRPRLYDTTGETPSKEAQPLQRGIRRYRTRR